MGVGAVGGVSCEQTTEFVATVSFDIPPVNAMDAQSYAAASDVLTDLASSEDIHVVVLTGHGRRAFCAGTDTSVFANDAAVQETTVQARRFFEVLSSYPLPLVGALNGPAVGGGAMIASECDVLVAASHTYFEIPEVQLGVVGAASHLKRLAPFFKIKRMMLLGERLTAQDAQSAGAILRTVEADRVLPLAHDIAQQIASLDPAAVREALSIFRQPESLNAFKGYESELAALERLRSTQSIRPSRATNPMEEV